MGSTQPGGRLDRATLGVAIEVVDEAIAGRLIPRTQYADFIAQIYEALLEGWPIGELVRYARIVAEELAGGSATSTSLRGIVHLRVV